jgi:hypothetical protein
LDFFAYFLAINSIIFAVIRLNSRNIQVTAKMERYIGRIYAESLKESGAIAIPLLLSLIVTLHFQTTQLRACVYKTLAASGHLSVVNMYSVLLVILTVFAIVHGYASKC